MATVLVVDDEPVVRDVVVRYLQRDGFATLEAGDGDDARELIGTGAPSLVVLDVMLPGTDGLELCRWIRGRSDLPVIMLTARGEETDRIVGLELGADDYVTKPFSPRELAARVRTVLRRATAARRWPQRLETGDVVLDGASRDVTKAGERCADVREFDLLWFLASHPRHVFSRDQLMESVWGYPAAFDTGTVTVHIRRLREKIEADPAIRAPPDGLGCRLQVRPVIGSRSLSPARASRSASPSRLRCVPPRGSGCSSRASRSCRSACRSPRCCLGLGDVPHGRRREDPRRRRRLGDRGDRGGAPARPLDRAPLRWLGDSRAARRRRSLARAPARRRAEISAARRGVQHDGRVRRAALRRATRARGLGEPRPAHTARVDAGDARGGRGRPRRADDYLPALREQVQDPDDPRRRPVRARPDRRRRADARAAADDRLRSSSVGAAPPRPRSDRPRVASSADIDPDATASSRPRRSSASSPTC